MCLFLCLYVGVCVCVFIVFCVHGEFPCPKRGWIVTVNRERGALNTTLDKIQDLNTTMNTRLELQLLLNVRHELLYKKRIENTYF